MHNVRSFPTHQRRELPRYARIMIAASANMMEGNSACRKRGQMGTGVDICYVDAGSERYLCRREKRKLPFRPAGLKTGNTVKDFQSKPARFVLSAGSANWKRLIGKDRTSYPAML